MSYKILLRGALLRSFLIIRAVLGCLSVKYDLILGVRLLCSNYRGKWYQRLGKYFISRRLYFPYLKYP